MHKCLSLPTYLINRGRYLDYIVGCTIFMTLSIEMISYLGMYRVNNVLLMSLSCQSFPDKSGPNNVQDLNSSATLNRRKLFVRASTAKQKSRACIRRHCVSAYRISKYSAEQCGHFEQCMALYHRHNILRRSALYLCVCAKHQRLVQPITGATNVVW